LRTHNQIKQIYLHYLSSCLRSRCSVALVVVPQSQSSPLFGSTSYLFRWQFVCPVDTAWGLSREARSRLYTKSSAHRGWPARLRRRAELFIPSRTVWFPTMGRPVIYRRRFVALTRTVCQPVEKCDPTHRMQILVIAGIWSKRRQ
jgi:hypothetical protein